MSANDPSSPLNISIVGAGIAGLTAAISLRRQGHNVEIFESSKNPTNIGSISIQINAFRVLKHLGASIGNLRGVEFGGLIGFNSESTEGSTQTWLISEAKEDPGIFCNRKDLADELLRLAIGKSGVGRPTNLRVGKKVIACDPDRATLALDDGEIIDADLVLGCDGIGSVIRTSIIGYNQKAPSSGFSCFRALFETSKIDGIPELAWIAEGVSGGRFVFGKDEPFRALFVNLCEDKQTINLVCIYTDPEQDNPEWTQVATHEEVIERFQGFHSSFRRILDLVPHDSFLRWKLLALPELPTWIRGRAAILGDAAHATFPFLGQGAAMAVEEGGALGCLLPLGTDAKDIPARLKAFQSLCKPRGDFVSAESVAQATDPSKRGRYFRSQELQAYILRYDPITAAQELLSELLGQPSV